MINKGLQIPATPLSFPTLTMSKAGRFFAFCITLTICFGIVLAKDNDEKFLMHSTVLDGDGRYLVQWGLKDKDDMIFKVTVKAKGYVALGFSPNGGMPGSDIVTGWVKDGKAFLQDRHAEGKFLPAKDKSQDWFLISGQENDTHTTLLFHRKLDTCDKDDKIIDSSTMRMIYAFSDTDPKDENGILYHEGLRGSKSVMMLQPDSKKKPNLEGTSYWDVLSPNHTIKTTETSMYWCKVHKAPELSKKHHVIMVEPLIQKGHESYLHHMILYECLSDKRDKYEEYIESEGHECYSRNMPEGMSKCLGVYAAWGVGGEGLVFPDNVGMPLDPSPPKYYMLEVHYDNPRRQGDFQDRSGLRLHYTPKLREHDAGSVMVGAGVSPRVIIPPGQPKYVVAGHAHPDCLGSVMRKEGLKMIGILQHAHLIGRQLRTRHFRKSTELRPLADDNNYDFNYQEYHYFPEEIDLMPEDQITVECFYGSTDRKTTTFGGLSSQEEMCVSFILYYPRINIFQSGSVPSQKDVTQLVGGDKLTKQLEGEDYSRYYDLLTSYNWSTVDIAAVEKGLRFGDHEVLCSSIAQGQKPVKRIISYPKDLKEYKVTSPCDDIVPTPSPTPGSSNSIYNHKWNLCIILLSLLLLI